MLNRDRTLYALSRFLREFLFAEKNTSLNKKKKASAENEGSADISGWYDGKKRLLISCILSSFASWNQ